MSGGHNRKPTVMKVLEGTARKDRMSPNEPQPEKVLIPPPMPEELNKYGQKEWKKMTLELSKIGVLTTIDLSQLEAYCNEIGNYWEAEANKRDASPLARKEFFDMAQKHLTQARAIAVQFGFTPASRGKLNVPKAEEKDAFDSL